MEGPQQTAPTTRGQIGPSPTRKFSMVAPLDEFDGLYRLFAEHLGWHPRDVDRLEVWEAARLLGIPDKRPAIPIVYLAAPGDDDDGAGGVSLTAQQMLADRVAAARSGGPAPDWNG